GFFGYAQLYPVQVNMNLVPPYSLKISDYHTASSDKLFVNLLLKDVSEFGRQVKLRFYVEGNGLAVRSKPFIVGANPIVLDGGVNTRLSNVDLRPYFKFENLQGLTPFQYSKALSDGVYNFCFEVYDYFSNQKISNKSCIPVYLILNDPPILNTPPKEELIAGQNPQNILFNWTPRHINATGVQYEFTIKEIWDSQIDPRAAFAISPMVYQTNTFSTTLLYGPGEPPLLEGKQYVWAVRAIVSDGISETSVFKNNGYSEVFWFRYTNNCKPPRFALAKALDASRMEISWQGLEHHRFEIQYRKKGYGDADWIRSYAYNNTTTLYNLEPKTTYEFRVGGECSLNAGFVFSNMQTFQTPSKEEVRNYSCGVLPEIEISN
ncbi:MAG: hypothetical protein OIF50_11655, partial [Flavobacteriaceae bacterium]|nr:hypothetical protein [Flavobacteriaceae bacterium]